MKARLHEADDGGDPAGGTHCQRKLFSDASGGRLSTPTELQLALIIKGPSRDWFPVDQRQLLDLRDARRAASLKYTAIDETWFRIPMV